MVHAFLALQCAGLLVSQQPVFEVSNGLGVPDEMVYDRLRMNTLGLYWP